MCARRGIASLLDAWLPLAEHAGRDVRVIALDRPGSAPGDDVLTAPLDLLEETAWLLGVLTACNVIQPATVAGHSFGASIAEATVRLHPERVSHLVLLDGSVVKPPRDGVRGSSSRRGCSTDERAWSTVRRAVEPTAGRHKETLGTPCGDLTVG